MQTYRSTLPESEPSVVMMGGSAERYAARGCGVEVSEEYEARLLAAVGEGEGAWAGGGELQRHGVRGALPACTGGAAGGLGAARDVSEDVGAGRACVRAVSGTGKRSSGAVRSRGGRAEHKG